MVRKDGKDVMNITMPKDVRKKLEEISKIRRQSFSSTIHSLIEEYYVSDIFKQKKVEYKKT